MHSVKHLGGVFIYSEQPEALAAWYRDMLGIQFEGEPGQGAAYTIFHYREQAADQARYALFSILPAEDDLSQTEKRFTMNLRVEGLAGMVDALKGGGVAVKGPETYPQGQFAWISDPDGNHIELWEDSGTHG